MKQFAELIKFPFQHEYKTTYVLGNFCHNGCQNFHKNDIDHVFFNQNADNSYKEVLIGAFSDLPIDSEKDYGYLPIPFIHLLLSHNIDLNPHMIGKSVSFNKDCTNLIAQYLYKTLDFPDFIDYMGYHVTNYDLNYTDDEAIYLIEYLMERTEHPNRYIYDVLRYHDINIDLLAELLKKHNILNLDMFKHYIDSNLPKYNILYRNENDLVELLGSSMSFTYIYDTFIKPNISDNVKLVNSIDLFNCPTILLSVSIYHVGDAITEISQSKSYAGFLEKIKLIVDNDFFDKMVKELVLKLINDNNVNDYDNECADIASECEPLIEL